MLDSGKFAIKMAKVKLNEADFRLSEQKINDGYCKYVREITDEEKDRYGYFPSIEIHSYGDISDGYLTLRFSIPRLIYGSNLFEIEENDFDKVVQTLIQKLRCIGIYVSENDIRDASIWELHTCQDFNMNNTVGVAQTLQNFHKLLFSKKLDNSITEYLHDDIEKGNFIEGLKFGLKCKSYEVCFYDKYKQICQDDKSREFMEAVKEQTAIKEVLRFEYRLYNSQAVKRELSNCGLSRNLTFEEIFKKDVVQRLNKHVWDKLFEPRMKIISALGSNEEDILNRLKSANITGKKAFDIYAAYHIYQSDGGFSGNTELLGTASKIISRLIKKLDFLPPSENSAMEKTFKMIKDRILNPQPMITYRNLVEQSKAIHY
ncbi:hypothetical protein HDR61_04705 [bacterium]|nr:hypothetical protein [bacterium]